VGGGGSVVASRYVTAPLISRKLTTKPKMATITMLTCRE